MLRIPELFISRRLATGILANFFGQAVNVGIQLLSIPIFLHFWTLEQYGVWLLISTIPMYVCMADLGFFTAMANRVTALAQSGDIPRANGSFHTGIAAFLSLTVVLGIFGITFSFINKKYMFVSHELATAITISTGTALMMLLGPIVDARYRAADKYARGVSALSLARLFDFGGTIAAVMYEASIESACIGWLAGRFIATIILIVDSTNSCQTVTWRPRSANLREAVSLVRPSASVLAISIGNALNIQTTILVVGFTQGPTIAATFSTYRTISRVCLQIVAAVSNSAQHEFARVVITADSGKLQQARQRLDRLVSKIAIFTCIIILAFLELILKLWTKGKIPFDLSAAFLILLATVFSAQGQIGRALLLATERQASLAASYITMSCVHLVFLAVLTSFLGLRGACLSLAVFELFYLFITRRLAGA